MTMSAQAVARQLAISPKDLIRQAIQAFLREQARFYNAERLRLCGKYGVSSLQEMDRLVAQGKVDEEAILQDFQRVDFLTAKLRKIEELMVVHQDLSATLPQWQRNPGGGEFSAGRC